MSVLNSFSLLYFTFIGIRKCFVNYTLRLFGPLVWSKYVRLKMIKDGNGGDHYFLNHAKGENEV